jgi:hypothetical protein
MIGPISFEAKQTGERNARNWHVAFDAAGAGNVAWSRCCDTRRRKSELTGNTNFDLNRRASLRPYLREASGANSSGLLTRPPVVPKAPRRRTRSGQDGAPTNRSPPDLTRYRGVYGSRQLQ